MFDDRRRDNVAFGNRSAKRTSLRNSSMTVGAQAIAD
jgi:hypothetical protein